MSDPLFPNPRPAPDGGTTITPDATRAGDTGGATEIAAPFAPPTPASPMRSHGAARAIQFGVAAVLVAALVAVWLDGRRAQQALRTQVAQRIAEIETAGRATAKIETQLVTDLRDAQAKIALLEARLAESQADQAALEALYRDLAPSRDEIALTEIEQVLLVASQQLQLAGNVQSALGALQLADARLQRLDRPQFLPLRRALTRDIDRLKAVPYVDVAGLSLKLDQAIAAVNTLPLAMDERLPPVARPVTPAAEPSWQRFARDLWTDIQQLVRIEVADRPAAPLIAPSQQYFLRENLRLRLLSARIALLNRDDASIKADSTAADNWLNQYFDTRSKSVQVVQGTLKQVAAAHAEGDMPDLTGSLEALRVLRLAQERAPSRLPDRGTSAADRRPH
jgi:uroporphyrin-III C-methyltransferase